MYLSRKNKDLQGANIIICSDEELMVVTTVMEETITAMADSKNRSDNVEYAPLFNIVHALKFDDRNPDNG